jgi:uncharacterized protein
MRTPHCTVALVVIALLGVVSSARAQAVEYRVFLRGFPVGVESVTTVRSADGVTVKGTERLGTPLNITVRQAEIRYGANGQPLEVAVEGAVRDELVIIRTAVNGTDAVTQAVQGTQNFKKTDKIKPDAVLLPNLFYGGYAALAPRLAEAKAGDEIPGYIVPVTPITLKVNGVTPDRIRTDSGVVEIRRYSVSVVSTTRNASLEVWVDSAGQLARLVIIEQSFDIVREDIAAVNARREPLSRPNDEQVTIAANGFSLSATVSKPKEPLPAKTGFPAVVLVPDSTQADRDMTVSDVPVFGSLASQLADAGFVVVRYDKRGLGQSGGRSESATVADYAEDVIGAVRYLARTRKDVDDKRIFLVGYGDGGFAALDATAREGRVSGLVLIGAPGEIGKDFVMAQQRVLLDRMKASDAERQAKTELQERINRAVMTGKGIETLPNDVRYQADTPWFQSFLTFDPAKAIQKIDQPLLVIHGELDRQVAPSNADTLERVKASRKNPKTRAVKVVKLPRTNHLLVPAVTGELDEYTRLTDKTVSRDVAAAIVEWVKAMPAPKRWH